MITHHAFEPELSSIREARTFVASSITDVEPRDAEAILMMVSELATNSVRHAASGFDVTVDRSPRSLRVEVSDLGPGWPQLREVEPSATSGRGLRIVELLSDRWGITERSPAGKVVWFTVTIP